MDITSKDNSKIKWAVKLCASAKFRRESKLFSLEGLRLCRDAVQNGTVPHTVFYTAAFAEKFQDNFSVITENCNQVFSVSEDVFAKLSDTESPQGVMCICPLPDFTAEIKKNGKYIILENVSDPSNIGAVARSAEAMGIDAVFTCGGCDIYSPKALRASMGALLRLPVEVCGQIEPLLERMSSAGITTFASVIKDYDCYIYDADFSGGCAIIIGNEANGVTGSARAACDKCVTIPMSGKAESLNAAAAAAILIYEMTVRS